ncbi:MAG: hypothetical protein WBO92_05225 [Candidatus Moraniibacteriota bacterium]
MLLFLVAVFCLSAGNTQAAPWFQDGFEWSDVATAISSGTYNDFNGDVTLSTTYAHSGSKSAKFCYLNNEDSAWIQFDVPGMTAGANNGATHIFLRWWELRAPNYDWSGEKFNRVMGLQSNGNLTLDYPLGWEAQGGWGQPGTNDAGPIKMFGNSIYSNGINIWSYSYAMPRVEWHAFEYEIKLNDVSSANGETRLWIDDNLVAQATNIELRYANYTLDRVWIGGWYSGGNDPEPSPTCRYVDDVAASTQIIGSGADTTPPAAPTGLGVQ